MDAVSIRVPYKNLKQQEVELTNVDESRFTQLEIRSDSSSPRVSNGEMNDSNLPLPPPPVRNSLLTLILSCTVAAGVQFGWALQLSLLTPYIQTLGIEHAFSSFIWLCGPITGLVVQPCVGIWSDKCHSKYGRRRPFIFIGAVMISIAVIIIGFSADIGYLLGDTKEHCSTFKGTRSRAAIVFVVGFWMLDLANNTVQGPARALLADLSGPDQRNTANAVFCSWMAVGNILGFSAGASGGWHRWFPFLTNRACCEPCGNLKAAFLVAVVFLTLCTLVTLYFANEVPLSPKQYKRMSDSAPLLDSPQNTGFDLSQSERELQYANSVANNESEMGHVADNSPKNEEQRPDKDQGDSFADSPGAVLVNLLTSLRHLPPAMHSVLIVMALTWLSWFPFFLFDTDWMGREVYHGDPKGEADEVNAYNQGVREGAFGLLLNSVVLGVSSFLIEPMCKWIGSRLVWAVSNFIVLAKSIVSSFKVVLLFLVLYFFFSSKLKEILFTFKMLASKGTTFSDCRVMRTLFSPCKISHIPVVSFGHKRSLKIYSAKMELSITQPDDWHLHLRDGDVLKAVVSHSAHHFGRAIVMPNLKPPITTTAAAVAYREAILKSLPGDSDFNPLMTLYLTDTTSPTEIKLARESQVVFGVKLYPAGATTNSQDGVTDLFGKCLPVLQEMVEHNMPLLVHGEVTNPEVDMFDREKVFIETVLRPLVQKFPRLKVVMEHVTTMDAVKFVESCSEGFVAATVTPQHLVLNRNSLFQGGLQPHNYCLPVLKREIHREALVSAVTSGSKRFFLGTDSAPHDRRRKECSCGCAGIYNAPVALSVYAKVFEKENALDKLEAFTSFNGPDFYGLPRNNSKIKLSKTPWKVPESFSYASGDIIPMFAGEMLDWLPAPL